jgi:FkbM family methyltransferase
MWRKVKRVIKATPFLGDALYSAKHYFNFYVRQSFGNLKSGELLLFDAIKLDIRNVFDVGARFNTDYADRSAGLPIKLYFFEPNPFFFKKLKKLCVQRDGHSINLYNFGFSNEPGQLTYYKDTQSFVKKHQMMESKLRGEKFEIKTLSSFCAETGIDHIDFLKIDVEGLDYHVLLGGRSIIQATCRYCQFELGIGAKIGAETIVPQHYYDFFAKNFQLYLVKDEDHPIYAELPGLPALALYTGQLRQTIERYLYEGSGPNLCAIRKGTDLPPSLTALMQLPGL